jgi:hypothetical protein
MAENTPSPLTPTPGGSSVPPKPPEPAKVQPKKETVRISLPPKPTSAPTIKLPAAPGGHAPASAAPAAAAAPAAPGSPARPATSAPATAGASAAGPASRPPTSTGPAATRPPGAAPAPRPAAPAVRRISGLDMGLAIAAAVIGLGAVGSVAFLLTLK